MTTGGDLAVSSGGAIAQDPNRTWEDNFNETPFLPGGKSGNQWEDWGQVMTQAIAPPMSCLEDVLLRTPIDDPLDQAEVAILWKLMTEEITCPAGHYNLELRFLRQEIRILSEVLTETAGVADDTPFDLDPTDWKDYGALFYSLPLTREECSSRMARIHERMKDLHALIEDAKRKGVFYDICGLIDWFATPPERRTTSTPAHTLAFFGRQLFGVLGIAAQNTAWAHIEAVTSRQIAKRFGGDEYENEKTRFQNMIPGMNNGPPRQFNVASNAPR